MADESQGTGTTSQPAAGEAAGSTDTSAADPKELAAKVAKLEGVIATLNRDLEKTRGNKKSAEERLSSVMKALGGDSNADPKDLLAQREASESKAKLRASRVREATLEALLGKPNVTPKMANLLALAAERESSVVVEDDGSVKGLSAVIKDYLEGGVLSIGGAGGNGKPADLPNPKGSASTSEQFKNVRTLADLTALGPVAFSEFRQAHPEAYARLWDTAGNVRK